MNASSCDQVAELIDLYAADECTRDQAKAVRRHLDDCETCRESLTQSRALQATLNLHFGQDAALQRLAARLNAASRQTPPARVLRFAHRFAAVAALLLVTFGLGIWLAPRAVTASPSIQLALAKPQHGGDIFPAPMRGKEAMGKAALESRDKLALAIKKAEEDGVWPPPPKIEATLLVTNASATPLELSIGGPDFMLVVEVRGPGVLRRTLPPDAPLLFAPRTVAIAPGASFALPIDRLASQIGNTVQNVYVKDAGEYEVRVRLDAMATRQGRRERVQERAGPLRLWLP